MTSNYLIVGGGISGTLLSYFLQKQNKSVILIDNPNLSSSSKVAAGLLNPITGKRMVKSWETDTLLPFALKTYSEIQSDLFQHKDIFRIFRSVQDQNDLVAKSKNETVINYLQDEEINNQNISSDFGSIKIKQGGYLPIKNLIDKLTESLNRISEKFDFDKLKIQDGSIKYENIKAEKIIFCEGYLGMNNPFFSWLPFAPTKGELLTIQSENLKLESIISKGIFILPIGNNQYKVGSSYDWNNLNENLTEDAKNNLLEKLDQIIKPTCSYKVLKHEAGVRPTVKDRRPFIGLHPEHPQVGIFNGMGSKSVLLAPYFANEFCNHLLNGASITKEANILRYWKS